MQETRAVVVVSEEQGEVAKFKKWDLDIEPHRRLLKEGIDLPESLRNHPEYRNKQRMDLDEAFKADEHPSRLITTANRKLNLSPKKSTVHNISTYRVYPEIPSPFYAKDVVA